MPVYAVAKRVFFAKVKGVILFLKVTLFLFRRCSFVLQLKQLQLESKTQHSSNMHFSPSRKFKFYVIHVHVSRSWFNYF